MADRPIELGSIEAMGRPVPATHAAQWLLTRDFAWLWWGRALVELPANTVALASFAIPVIATLSAWIQLGAAPPSKMTSTFSP